MNDPRYDLYDKEHDFDIENNEEIKNAYKEIEKHKQEIIKLEGLIKKWKHEIIKSKRMQGSDVPNTMFKQLLDSETPKPAKKAPTPSQQFMTRKVHSFYNDRLFDGNCDNKLVYQTESSSDICAYTKTPLSLRYIPLSTIEEILQPYKVLTLSKLFKVVRPPGYVMPEELHVSDYCVVGIIHEIMPIKYTKNEWFGGKKIDISPHDGRSNTTGGERGRGSTTSGGRNFNVIITDLKHTLLLTIHGNDLIKEYYHSLKAGDVIMIETPSVYKTTKGFGLSITEEGGRNQIMEVGKSGSYSKCGVELKSGGKCSGFYDNRSHKACEYHEEMDMDVKLSRRMELNSGYLGRRVGPQEKKHNTNVIGKVDLNFKSQKSFNRFHKSLEYGDDHDSFISKKEQKRVEKSKKENLKLLRQLQMKSDSTNTSGIKKAIMSNKNKNEKKKSEMLELLKKDLLNKHK